MKKSKPDFFISTVIIGFVIAVFATVFTTVYHEGYLKQKQVCKETDEGTILSIKDMKTSSGFLSSKSLCIYGTTKGDIVKGCYYDVGDKINPQTSCKYE